MIGAAPFSARAVVHPGRREDRSTRHPLRAGSCVIAPSELFGRRLRCEIGAAAPGAPEATTVATTRPTARTDHFLVNASVDSHDLPAPPPAGAAYSFAQSQRPATPRRVGSYVSRPDERDGHRITERVDDRVHQRRGGGGVAHAPEGATSRLPRPRLHWVNGKCPAIPDGPGFRTSSEGCGLVLACLRWGRRSRGCCRPGGELGRSRRERWGPVRSGFFVRLEREHVLGARWRFSDGVGGLLP